MADQPLRAVIAGCLTRDPARRPGLADILTALGDSTVADAILRAPAGRHAYAGPSPSAGFPPPAATVLAADGPGARDGGTVALRGPLGAGPIPPVAAPTAQGPGPGPEGRASRRRGVGRRTLLFAGLGVAAAAVGVPVGLKLSSGSSLTKVILQRGTNAGSYSVSFSPDGKTLASGNGDGTIRLWDVGTMKNTFTLPQSGTGEPVYGLAFAPDGKTLAATSGDGSVGIWRPASGKNVVLLRSSIAGEYALTNGSVAFDPAGRYLATSYDASTAQLRDAATGNVITTVDSQGAWINALAFSPNGQLLATGSAASPTESGSVKLWNIPSGSLVRTVAQANTVVEGMAFAGDLASVSTDGTVSAWNITAGTGGFSLSNAKPNAKPNAQSVAFNSDGSQLMSGNTDGTVTIWDWASQQVTKTLDTGMGKAVSSVAFGPGSSPRLACAGPDLVLWIP